MTATLWIAKDLALPLDAVTETIAVLGIRGSGKTNTATVLAEELLEHGQQVVIVDPTNVWWGLKSSADGTRPGYPVIILGGPKSDLPLAAGDGKTIADFLVETRASVILSLRHFESKGEQRRFLTDLARRLYFRKGEEGRGTPLMLIIDEAGLFVPQRVGRDEAQMVGAIQQLVRQGRASGFGVTLVDQRAASVNKDVLTQLELLICHRTSSPQDRKALEAWIEQHDTEDHGGEFLSSIASLPRGAAWFWSPGWLDIFAKVEVRMRHTFDSSRTPKPGERITAPTKVAMVDLEALKARLGETIEKARAEDPAALRKEIARLQSELKKAGASKPATVDPAAIDRAVHAAIAKRANAAGKALDRVAQPLGRMRDLLGAAIDGLDGVRAAWQNGDGGAAVAVLAPPAPRTAAAPAPRRATAPVTSEGGPIGKGERIVLTAVAQYPDGADREQLSVLTGYKRSSRDTFLQRLQAADYVETVGAGVVVATEAGLAALGPDFEPLPTGDALRDYWMQRLPEGERRVLGVLIEAYPDAIAREEIDEVTGYKRSSRDTYLQRLGARKLAIAIGRGEVRASPTLFEEGR